ncbi:MAG: hypothetical protein KIT22_20455, partial [Verrucomicrobiae bacterium]|nr:hypothetical protein [Verrucomicrobiae bacterium]
MAWILFASGAAALAHQVVWTRRLVDILGASAETFSRVVGAFCIGLALGSAWASLRPANPTSGWSRILRAELAVAGLGALSLAAVPIADTLREWAVSDAWLRGVLPLSLVAPPAIAMGLVLPSALAVLPPGPSVVRAYAVNTFGGVAGIALAVFWALPALGLVRTGLGACLINLSVAAGAWLAWRRDPRPTLRASAPFPDAGRVSRPQASGAIAFASGFLVMGLEVTAQQQFAQVTINSHFSGSALLVIVLLALAAASLVAVRWPGSESWAPRTASLIAAGV